MRNRQYTIRKIVTFLNNPDEEGGFWLPNIQRSFVWTEDQIYRLFDSILREYPISTMLVWKTNSQIRRRKFIDNWSTSLRISDFYVPQDDRKKCLVLDGQQRLQSLYIGLCGSFEGKELYFDILSGQVTAPDDIRYRFSFLHPDEATFPWIKFKDLVFTTWNQRQVLDSLIAAAGRTLSDAEIDRFRDHLNLVDRTFIMHEAVTYQELDSIDNPILYTDDDVVEVFIRANAGGTRLSRSDLLFSLLGAAWDEADEKMEALLDSLNRHGFDFDRDFVLKTCLVLLGQAARYEVKKFREHGVRENIEANWTKIAQSIQDVLDFVRGETYIQHGRALPSYLALIPLIYLRYHYKAAWERAANVNTYIVRCSLSAAFSGQPDTLLDKLTEKLASLQAFDLDEVFGVIRSQNRPLELTEDRLWEIGYNSNAIHLLFNLWYGGTNYDPDYINNLPEIDHVFPQSALREVKVLNPQTGRMIMKYGTAKRNQLANCQLLRKGQNRLKSNQLPEQWFPQQPSEYFDQNLIPTDSALWQIDRFDDFIEARKALIRAKFQHLLVPVTTFSVP